MLLLINYTPISRTLITLSYDVGTERFKSRGNSTEYFLGSRYGFDERFLSEPFTRRFAGKWNTLALSKVVEIG